MFSLQDEKINEEVEEVRELLYNIVKDFPTGITSTFLEQQYANRYVKSALANPLPKNWLNLLRHTEEFRVRDISTYTLLYLASADIPHQQNQQWEGGGVSSLEPEANSSNGQTGSVPVSSNNINNHNHLQQHTSSPDNNGNNTATAEKQHFPETIAPLSEFFSNQFEPVPLSNLPTNGGPIRIEITSALDPDTIFFRLDTWDPYCEYLFAALKHLPSPASIGSPSPGQILGANVDGKWERVELIRPSMAKPQYWVVRLVDVGHFHAVSTQALRPFTEAVTAFKKILLAICKLDGIQSRTHYQEQADAGITSEDDGSGRVLWPPETQHYISEALLPATLKNKRVELVTTGEWQYKGNGQQIPTCTGRLSIDGVDFGEQLVSMGLAQRK